MSGPAYEETHRGHSGTGPGAITPDGCAVEVYTRVPAGDEPGIIASAVPAGASLLELGCGAGRVTHPLLERGFTVTAVDESPRMLEHVRGARTVCSPIETLELDERFDAVVLASFLVHTGDVRARDALLRACRRHVADDGCVLIQREGEDWHERVPRERKAGGGLIRIAAADPTDDPRVSAIRCEYVFPDATWTQTFLSRRMDREEFEAALAGAGLAVDSYLTDDRTWVRALPAE
ncbi:class I SAM-dependent methyltransferase [Streptomyces verrucosisporus]|uniref:class I SAM-dependent methyltransferase n=1 Tax=Streptomyces verrucosisporus TaxID=1695161 RepID=UPI0019D19D9E|nr:class I SAM-dependent methyltransferase [Streptomyces verrucosisporus]MBN3929651.1 class I SAM-dependent methyltransferase [Streptomyces verrucosisporus]